MKLNLGADVHGGDVPSHLEAERPDEDQARRAPRQSGLRTFWCARAYLRIVQQLRLRIFAMSVAGSSHCVGGGAGDVEREALDGPLVLDDDCGEHTGDHHACAAVDPYHKGVAAEQHYDWIACTSVLRWHWGHSVHQRS